VDQLIVGGGIANTFMLAAGLKIGKSLAEPDLVAEAKAVIAAMKARGAEVPIPTDVVCAKTFAADAVATIKKATEVADSDIDLVCVMSVFPGFGGQKFIEGTYEKVIALKSIIQKAGANTLIEIDGGVSESNASALVTAGADVLVAGTTVFKAADPIKTISQLRNC